MTAHDDRMSLIDLEGRAAFVGRHIGPPTSEKETMLEALGVDSIEELIDATVPDDIKMSEPLNLLSGIGQQAAQDELRVIAASNQIHTSLIGMGYPRHHHSPGHTPQYHGKPRLVHRLHALSARDLSRTPRSAP